MNEIRRPAIHDSADVALLSNSLFRLFDRLVELAAQGRAWGVIPAMAAKALAFTLRVPSAYILERGLAKLAERGLVETQEGGALWLPIFGDGGGPAAAPAPAPAPATPSRATQWRHSKRDADVSPGVSRPSGETGPGVSQPVSPAVSSGVSPRTHVRDVNVKTSPESEDYKIISESSETLGVNVAAGDETPAATAVETRTSLAFPHDTTVRNRDVSAVIHLTNDDKSRGRWIQLWKHCNTNARLDLWDEAYGVLSAALKSPQPPVNRGASLNLTLCNLLRDAGIPVEQGTAAERAEAQAEIGELRKRLQEEGDGEGGLA